MATAREFAEQLLKIPGIKGYCLLRGDGRIVVQNLSGDEGLTTLVSLAGRVGEALRNGMGFQYFRYLTLTRQGQEHLLVFPVETYLLGIVQKPGVMTSEVAESVSRFILTITGKPRSTAPARPS